MTKKCQRNLIVLRYGQLLKQVLSQIGKTWQHLERAHKEKCTIYIGTWTYWSIKCHQKNYHCLHTLIWQWKISTVETNAKLKGFGAVLLQEDNPVYFASKSLQLHQKAYIAIELDSLAVAWAMEKNPITL